MEANYWNLPHALWPTRWERFCLLFCRQYVAFDALPSDPFDASYAVFYKVLRGKVFIVGEEMLAPLK